MAGKDRVKGVKRYKHPVSGIWYCYHRKTGKRIESEWMTADFLKEVAALDGVPARASVEPRRRNYRFRFKILAGNHLGVARDQRERAAKKQRTPTVYVVGFGDYVKIGFTSNIGERLRMIQTHAPEPLKLYALFHSTPGLERRLHARFAEHRLQGEWFRNAGALRQWLSEQRLSELAEPDSKEATI